MSAFQLRDLLQPSHACPDIYSPVELSILRRASELLARSLKRQTFRVSGFKCVGLYGAPC